MRNSSLVLLWVIFLSSCIVKSRRPEVSQLKLPDLSGLWVNEELKNSKFPLDSTDKLFYPISGITVSNSPAFDTMIIRIEYGEQVQNIVVSSPELRDDSLFGTVDHQHVFVAILNDGKTRLSQFQFIDTTVYLSPIYRENKNASLIKIADCIGTDIPQIALNGVYIGDSLMVKDQAGSVKLIPNLANCRSTGIIDGGSIFKDYRLLRAYTDQSGNKTIDISMTNLDGRKHSFLRIIYKNGIPALMR